MTAPDTEITATIPPPFLTLEELDAALLEAFVRFEETGAGVLLDEMRGLLARGASPDAKFLRGQPLLHAAIYAERALRVLLASPTTDANVPDADGWTPLMRAAAENRIWAINLLLATPGIDLTRKNPQGQLASAVARAAGHEELGEYLEIAERRAFARAALTPEERGRLDQELRNTAQSPGGTAKKIESLLDRGADINGVGKENFNALVLWAMVGQAFQRPSRAVGKALLSAPGVDVNALCGPPDRAFCALTENASNDLEETIDMMLARPETDVLVQDHYGRASKRAREYGDLKKKLASIEQAALDQRLLDATGYDGAVPGETEAALAAGADPNARDELGRTPLMRIAIFNHANPEEAAKILLADAGTDLNAWDGEDRTAWYHCAKNKQPGLARLLLKDKRHVPSAEENRSIVRLIMGGEEEPAALRESFARAGARKLKSIASAFAWAAQWAYYHATLDRKNPGWLGKQLKRELRKRRAGAERMAHLIGDGAALDAETLRLAAAGGHEEAALASVRDLKDYTRVEEIARRHGKSALAERSHEIAEGWGKIGRTGLDEKMAALEAPKAGKKDLKPAG